MNDRLREFERRSGLEIYGLGKDRAKWKASVEKFAELIVLEMCDVFDKRAEPGTGFYEPQEPAEMIREHFGVEE
jgi:hypothetical protein